MASGRRAKGLIASYNYPRIRGYLERGSLLTFDMDHVAAMIAPRAFLNITGTQDPYFPNREDLLAAEGELAALYEWLGEGERFKAIHLDRGHRYSAEVADMSQRWFDRWLWGSA